MSGIGNGSGSGSNWNSSHSWGNSRGCPYYNAENAQNRRGYPTVSVPSGNGFSALEAGQWALGGSRGNPLPVYQAPHVYTTPQMANSNGNSTNTNAVVAPLRSASNP
jgi:hypothetical protein